MTVNNYNYTKQFGVVKKVTRRFTKINGQVKEILAGWTKKDGVVEQVYGADKAPYAPGTVVYEFKGDKSDRDIPITLYKDGKYEIILVAGGAGGYDGTVQARLPSGQWVNYYGARGGGSGSGCCVVIDVLQTFTETCHVGKEGTSNSVPLFNGEDTTAFGIVAYKGTGSAGTSQSGTPSPAQGGPACSIPEKYGAFWQLDSITWNKPGNNGEAKNAAQNTFTTALGGEAVYNSVICNYTPGSTTGSCSTRYWGGGGDGIYASPEPRSSRDGVIGYLKVTYLGPSQED